MVFDHPSSTPPPLNWNYNLLIQNFFWNFFSNFLGLVIIQNMDMFDTFWYYLVLIGLSNHFCVILGFFVVHFVLLWYFLKAHFWYTLVILSTFVYFWVLVILHANRFTTYYPKPNNLEPPGYPRHNTSHNTPNTSNLPTLPNNSKHKELSYS